MTMYSVAVRITIPVQSITGEGGDARIPDPPAPRLRPALFTTATMLDFIDLIRPPTVQNMIYRKIPSRGVGTGR